MADLEYHRNRKRERRKKFLMMLGGKCERCGNTQDLHFDHINPNKKQFNIANILNFPDKVVEKELKNCRLLCADCHRTKTRENGDHAYPPARHGTTWKYKLGCRCDDCRLAMSNYNKQHKTSTIQDSSIHQLSNNRYSILYAGKETIVICSSYEEASERLDQIKSGKYKKKSMLDLLLSRLK